MSNVKTSHPCSAQNIRTFGALRVQKETSHTWAGKAGCVARTSEVGGVCSLRILQETKSNPNFDVKLKTVQEDQPEV